MAGIKLGSEGIFRRRNKQFDDVNRIPEEEEEAEGSDFEEDITPPVAKAKSRRPNDSAFMQQKLGSINYVVRPATVIPLYMLLAMIFIGLGVLFYLTNLKIDEIIIYYQDCDRLAPPQAFGPVPADSYSAYYHKDDEGLHSAQWSYIPPEEGEEDGKCRLRFQVPHDIKGPIYVNYLIENFNANHRRYVLSFSPEQLKGLNASYEELNGNLGLNCRQLTRNHEGKLYYPCGLIANAMFNDSYPLVMEGVGNTADFPLTNKGINWPDDKDRYKKTHYSPDEIVPPPYWMKRFPNGYNETNIPDLQTWEEFQNWMRAPALPRFSKLMRRSDSDLPAGIYEMEIGLHWPVSAWKNGRKALYITNANARGGRNSFLGIAYLASGGLAGTIALLLLTSYFLFGRKLGDTTLLSWNR